MKYIFKAGFMGFMCFASIMFTSMAYGQQTYQVEASAAYLSWEDDDDNEEKLYGLELAFHPEPVDVGGHPLAEAAFMERIGNVSVFVGRDELDFGSGIEADGPTFGMQILYAQPGQPIVAQLYFIKARADFDAPVQADMSTDTYGLGIGTYISDGLRVTLNYESTETEASIWGSVFEKEHDRYNIDVKWVKELAKSSAINLMGEIAIDRFDTETPTETDDGSNTIFGVSADYYLNPYVSLGGGLEINTGDDEEYEGESIEARFRAFLHPQFSVGVEYEHFSADNEDVEDDDTIVIVLAARF